MLTDEEFRLFRNLIHEESGIFLKETRKDFLESRLQKRMLAIGAGSPYRYYRHISNGGRDELISLLDLLTINETSFFRNRPQIELFRKIILPEMIRAKARDPLKRLRIWSAGCSTGEEPYTVAIVVSEVLGDLRGWDIRIFASDLSLSALSVASRAEYDGDKVHATVDDSHITRYFEKICIPEERKDARGETRLVLPAGAGPWRYRVREAVRRLIVFDFHNLKHDSGSSGFDVIFCRNVMIYFDESEQRRLVERFSRSLNSDGYLLLGHSESLHGWASGFEFVYQNKGTAYRKKGKDHA